MFVNHPTIGLIFMTIGAHVKLALILFCTLMTPAFAGESTMATVFKMLASQPRSDVSFVEKKHSGFLDDSIELKGILRYLPPDTIIREQHSPKPLRFEITGNIVNMQRNGKKTRIKLDTIPTLNMFVNSFRAILLGDIVKLESYYKIDFSGTEASWSMTLQPISIKLSLLLENIKFSGSQGVIETIEIRENEEDWSEMHLTPISASNGHEKN